MTHRKQHAPARGDVLDEVDQRLLDAIDACHHWQLVAENAGLSKEEAQGRLLRMAHLPLVGARTAGRVEAAVCAAWGLGAAASVKEERLAHQPMQPPRPVSAKASHASQEHSKRRREQSRVNLGATEVHAEPIDAALLDRLRAVDPLLSRLHSSTHYEILGVAPDAKPEQIRRAYFQLVRQCASVHPQAVSRSHQISQQSRA